MRPRLWFDPLALVLLTAVLVITAVVERCG
jgi:hypothetical protein